MKVYKKTNSYTEILLLSYIIFFTFAEIFSMKKISITLMLLICCIIGVGQNSVQYNVEPAIETIQNDYIKIWNKLGEINGYRIQIGALTGANSKNTAENERLKFQNLFPEIPAYITYMEPYFRIRVGNFYSRIDAYRVLLEIQATYPNAYIVPDKITYLE